MEIRYLEGYTFDYSVAIWQTVRLIMNLEFDGDILVFVPGEDDIQRVTKHLLASKSTDKLTVLPLHASPPPPQKIRLQSTRRARRERSFSPPRSQRQA
jgi:HrpA-like RNA helicase